MTVSKGELLDDLTLHQYFEPFFSS